MQKIGKNKAIYIVLGILCFLFTLVVLFRQALLLNDLFFTTAVLLCLFFLCLFLLQKRISNLWWVITSLSVIFLFVIRLFSDQYEVRKVDEVNIMLLVIIALLTIILLLNHHQSKNLGSYIGLRKLSLELSRKKILFLVLLLIILGIASFQSIIRLGDRDFHNDEYYHVEAAHGYLQTGEYVQWDFSLNKPKLDEQGEWLIYERAWPLTWQVAQSIKMFGDSEFSMRLPAVVWFLLFLVLSFYVVWRWQNDVFFAFFVVFTFSMFDHFILHSRLVRMYSMLLFFSTVAICSWLMLYKESITSKFKSKRSIFYLCVSIVSTFIAVLTHKIFLVFFPAFAFFLFIEFILAILYYRRNNKSLETIYRHLFWIAIVMIAAAIGLVVSQMGLIDLLRLVGLRNNLNTDYEITIFADLGLPLFALCAFLVGSALLLKSKDQIARFIAIMPLSVIFLFIFLLLRYNAIRYILFIVPIAILIICWFVYRVISSFIARIDRPKIAIIATLVIAILLVTPISFPGVGSGILFQLARADRTATDDYGHDFSTAYEYIRLNKKVDEPILTVNFRSYYWQNDPDLEVVNLGYEKSMSINEFQEIIAQYPSYWVVYAHGKAHHIRASIKDKIKNNCLNVSELESVLQNTNMHCYYCGNN